MKSTTHAMTRTAGRGRPPLLLASRQLSVPTALSKRASLAVAAAASKKGTCFSARGEVAGAPSSGGGDLLRYVFPEGPALRSPTFLFPVS
eukprot:scaffold1023_cov313-Pinguiococcus_pyrenoidosus.AAC.17